MHVCMYVCMYVCMRYALCVLRCYVGKLKVHPFTDIVMYVQSVYTTVYLFICLHVRVDIHTYIGLPLRPPRGGLTGGYERLHTGINVAFSGRRIEIFLEERKTKFRTRV
jgi:hypothetical protein